MSPFCPETRRAVADCAMPAKCSMPIGIRAYHRAGGATIPGWLCTLIERTRAVSKSILGLSANAELGGHSKAPIREGEPATAKTQHQGQAKGEQGSHLTPSS